MSLLPADAVQPQPETVDPLEIRRRGVKRLLLTLPAYAAVIGVLWVGVSLGVVSALPVLVLAAVIASGLAGFYLVLRAGVMTRSADPLLAFPQVLFNLAISALWYAIADNLRGAALLWLSLVIVFDMRRLPPRQVRFAAGFSLLALVLVTAGRALLHSGPQNWPLEFFMLGLPAVLLPVLMAVAAQARVLRRRQLRQKEQMALALEQLRQLSIRDGLTGLFNRGHMLELLDAEARRTQRSGRGFSVALLDIDFFKRVNDGHGHAVGDAVLRDFARLGLSVFSQEPDALARWGGEEFLLLLPGATAQEAAAALEGLRAEVHAHDWGVHARGLAVTFSAGVCAHRPGDAPALSLEQADEALYAAKAAGRDRVLVGGEGERAAEAAGPRIDRRPAGADAPRLALAASAATGEQAEPAAVPRRGGPWQRLRDLPMIGLDERLRPFQYMCLLSGAVYLACIAGFLGFVQPAGMLDARQTHLFVAHNLIGAFAPSVLLRLPMTARLRDPTFALAQLLWAGTGLLVAYALMPGIGSVILQMIAVCVVFGLAVLRVGEALILGLYLIGALLLVFGLRWASSRSGIDLRLAGIEVAMSCVVLWLLTVQSLGFARSRERVREEKRKLAEATGEVNRVLMHDALTGLFNRQHMQHLLERECGRHRRSAVAFCVALVDLDHFKRINDGYGHRVGDEALAGFAAAAREVLRETDVLARWGGEEFLVLLPESEPVASGLLALDRLREALAARRLCPAAPQLQVTFSAGVAEYRPGEAIEQTLARADQALYAAKAAGRNCCRVG
ncbi:MAG: GGDEF domain-containing protein [Aquabacterium sp.]|nr:MAG: GGDEF domain-containing protein [Aquabacterium sp.]